MQRSAVSKAVSNFRSIALDILGQNFGHKKKKMQGTINLDEVSNTQDILNWRPKHFYK